MRHAVVRLDRFLTRADAAEQADAITIVAVLPTHDEAEELARLMRLRADDNLSYYFSMAAPYYPGGHEVQP